MKWTVLVCSLPALAVAQSTLNVYHRVFHPVAPPQPYILRGVLTISVDGPSLQQSPTLSDDLAGFANVIDTEDSSLYQVALQHEDDTSDGQWDVSSIKACHLRDVSSETIILHVDGASNSRPFAIDYFVSPVPHDASCFQPKSKKLKSKDTTTPSPFQSFSKNVQRLNTTVLLQRPALPPLPELRIPPPLTQEGEVVKPVPEKTFLQKYWMYIVAIMIALVFSGGGEEEQPRRPA